MLDLYCKMRKAVAFFVIAAAIMPIQFAQLRGTTHSMLGRSGGILDDVFSVFDISVTSISTYGLVCLVSAIPITAFCLEYAHSPTFFITNRI